jgi:hypothetical protein
LHRERGRVRARASDAQAESPAHALDIHTSVHGRGTESNTCMHIDTDKDTQAGTGTRTDILEP